MSELTNDAECAKAGVDPEEVVKIANGLSRYAKQAKKLGIQIFGGSGCGTLRFDDGEGILVLSTLSGTFDGGDGAEKQDSEGLWRGE